LTPKKIYMNHNILVTGSKGQLGRELESLLSNDANKDISKHFYFTDRDTLDITNKAQLRSYVEENHIGTIVNCAAYTAVDKAEEEKELAFRVNHEAVKYMAEIALEKNIKLIHVSTDYVFDGTSCTPLIETDPANPKGIYGLSKYSGETEILRIKPPGAIIIRTSWVYSSFGQNFVHTMLRLGKERDTLNVVSDQIGTPTYAHDLAQTILVILAKKPTLSTALEIYHYSNEGVCSWYDFAQAIFEITNIDCKVFPISTEEYPTPAKRPKYSVLNKNKIRQDYSLIIPYWRDSLKSCISLLDTGP